MLRPYLGQSCGTAVVPVVASRRDRIWETDVLVAIVAGLSRLLAAA
jgi:hypothetical protein